MEITADKRIIALCASHINGPLRLKTFEHMIGSWDQQEELGSTAKFSIRLLVSLSYEPKLEAIVKATVRRLLSKYRKLQIIVQPKKLSQFQHYAKLIATLSKCSPSTFIMFSDDDDLWHPKRAHSFVVVDQMNDVCVKQGTYVELDISEDLMMPLKETLKYISTVKPEVTDKTLQNTNSTEYTMFAVRLHVVREFFNILHPELLKHKHCHILFVRYYSERYLAGPDDQYLCVGADDEVPWFYCSRRTSALDNISENFDIEDKRCSTRAIKRVLKNRPLGDLHIKINHPQIEWVHMLYYNIENIAARGGTNITLEVLSSMTNILQNCDFGGLCFSRYFVGAVLAECPTLKLLMNPFKKQ